MKKIISADILAGIYRGNMEYRGTGLIHSYIEGEEKTLCKRIKVDHLADGLDEDTKPTCIICLKKDYRFNNLISP